MSQEERDERVVDLVSVHDDVTLAGMYVDLESRLREVEEAARPFAEGPNPCACLGPPGDCPCVHRWRENEARLREALEGREP